MMQFYQQIFDYQIITKQKMFTDIQSKYQYTVLTQQTKLSCPCGNYDSYVLREKLQEILNSLTLQISSKDKQIQTLHLAYQQNIKEKEEIIQRLVSANSMLTITNQQLTKKLSKSLVNFKATISSIQNKWQAKTKEMTSVIEYLEQKNEHLRTQAIPVLSLPSEQSYSFKKNLNNVNNIKSVRSSNFLPYSDNKGSRSPRVSIQMQSGRKNHELTGSKYRRLTNNQNRNEFRQTIQPGSNGFLGLAIPSLRSKSVKNKNSLQKYSG